MKKSNWTIALHQQIVQFNDKQFAWGTHDCCTFAADCVLAMTGLDKMANYRGGYSTQQGATKKLIKAGGIEAAITKELGEPLENRLMVKRGDVVCFPSPLGDSAGICVGSQIAAAGFNGVVYMPITQAFKAWRV